MPYIVQTASASMPSSVRAPYGRVAVLEVEPGYEEGVSSISERARGVIRIVDTWERLFIGETHRSAFYRALEEAREMALQLNLIEEAWFNFEDALRESELGRFLLARLRMSPKNRRACLEALLQMQGQGIEDWPHWPQSLEAPETAFAIAGIFDLERAHVDLDRMVEEGEGVCGGG